MTAPGIDVDLRGPFFTADINRTITDNAEDACKWLIRQGPPLIRGHLRQIKNPSGFTAGLPETVMYSSLPPSSHFSAFGIVWPRSGATRGGSRLYPAARVPYIINAVLESGNYAGKRSSRKAIKQWYQTRVAMRHMAARITVDMAKGLT
jgi:hypothetical protein